MAFGLLGSIAGIALVIVGVYMIFFLPLSIAHQGEDFGVVGIVTGVVFVIIGLLLFFLP